MIRRVVVCMLGWMECMAAQNVPFRVQTKVVQVPVSATNKNGRRPRAKSLEARE
jgi:hypothetical protein